MKYIFCLLLLLRSGAVLSQSHPVRGILLDGETNRGYRGEQPILTFTQADTLVGKIGSDSIGMFRIPHLPPGIYDVHIADLFKRPGTHTNVVVTDNAQLTFVYPSPCRFVYTHKGIPPCVGGHIDRIIPMSYGLPTAKTLRRAKRGKVYLAGCELWGCDPRYYCPVHQKEL